MGDTTGSLDNGMPKTGDMSIEGEASYPKGSLSPLLETPKHTENVDLTK